MLVSFNDICIIPSVLSDIEHRSECFPYLDNEMLPLFTAPMSSVIDENNWQVFKENKINTIIPRSVSWETRLDLSDKTFIAVSLSEFERLIDFYHPIQAIYVCVDIANGHMKKLLDLCKQAKEKFGDKIQLMAGNIANPDTYYEYAKAGIDYVRCAIGSGSCCTTSSNVGGIHYPMVSLLQDIIYNKKYIVAHIAEYGNIQYKSIPKIVADGGFSNFDQIIKALAIGADYVMLGKIFAMSKEACGKVIINHNGDRVRKYYGMSTKKAQTEISGEATKTAEGIETLVPIKYTLAGWCDNFISYLRSAMSYCNSRTLDQFRQNAKIKQISNNSFNSYFK